MKTIYSSILLRLALLLAVAAAASSCADDLLEAGPGGVMDGSTRQLAVTVAYDSEDEQPLDSRAADIAQPGNSIQNIDNLRLLIYNKEGELLEDFPLVADKKANASEMTGTSNPLIKVTGVAYLPAEDNRLPDEKDDGYQDSATGKVTFRINLPTDKYYIYAVANAPDLTRDQLAKRNEMKNIPRRWVVGDLSQNSEMFGIFSHGPNREAKDDTPLSITTEAKSLHCWLRRLASKVTVAFDGTQLYDNVQVYIDSICLFDIPQQCLLGNPNTAGRNYDDKIDLNAMHPIESRYRDNTNGLIYKGPYQIIQELPDGDNGQMLIPESYAHVCNAAHPYLGKGKEGKDTLEISKRHGHTAASLFFYENLQGTGNSKRQDADNNNKIDNPNPIVGIPSSGWKDGKAYGTYVQVHGHYRSSSPVDADGLGTNSGPIRYRFMLGKNVEDDFNAERNTHYKLTLCLKGYGNDADWHIEYEHKRGIVVASPQFISYLYNKKMMASIKVTGTIPDGAYLKAEIEGSYNDQGGKFLLEQSSSVGGQWKPWGDGSDFLPNIQSDDFITKAPTEHDGPWNGFLSLRQTKVIKIENPNLTGIPSNEYGWNNTKACLKNYYYGNAPYTHNPIGRRFYKTEPNPNGYESNATNEDGMYFVSATQGSGKNITERVFSIPIYTRAKELVTWSGYSGNNLFEQYARKQRIKISIVQSDQETLVDGFEPVYLDIIQVPRITNPKGVWRSKGNPEKFHVQLSTLDPRNPSTFKVFSSIGKWSAEVISAGAPIITLTSTTTGSGSGNSTQSNVNRIEGEGGHPIDFDINFNGGVGCAVVKVRYHNYTCEHDIFCRSGYEDPIDIAGNGQRWSSFNVDYFDGDKAMPTKSPLQEGSLFRRGCRTAILSSNSDTYGFGVYPSTTSDHKFAVKKSDKNETRMAWDDIKTTADDTRLNDWVISNTGEHIATIGDFYTLVAENGNDINFKINKGYGVLYGDGAKETQLTTAMAYGYNDPNGGKSEKGMRGVFVCNYSTYNQIFLPLGMAGHGRRKATPIGWFPAGNPKDEQGTMRYATRTAIVDWNYDTSSKNMMHQRPLFYDLAERPGAIYWAKVYQLEMPKFPGSSSYSDARASSAFDINYFTMGFEGFQNGAANSQKTWDGVIAGSDACFIRTVFGEAK